MANALADYLISIGFDVKETEKQKLKEAVREGAFQADVLYESLSGAVKQFDAFVRGAADGLNQLFISSRTWSTSASGMAVFGEAAQRVGVSTQQAQNFLKLFTDQSAKANPLVAGLAQNFANISDAAWKSLSPTQRALAFLKGMSTQSEFVQSNFADKFGVSYEQLKQLENPEFFQSIEHVEGIYKDLGLDFDGSSKSAHNLSLALLDLSTTLNGIATKGAAAVFDRYGKDIQALQLFLQEHGKEIADTIATIATGLINIVNALSRMSQSASELQAIVTVTNLLGKAFEFVADQLDRISNNKVAQALGFVSGSFNGPMGIFGAINDLGGDFNKDGSFGEQSKEPSDNRNWWQRNAPSWLGGKSAPERVAPTRVRGSLATNQQEAYKAARAEGLSDAAARALVADFSGESLRNPGDVHADPSRSNPGQKAHGIASWDDTRSAAIAQQFGKMPNQMSVAEQTRAAIWEMKNNPTYRASWDALNSNASANEIVPTLVRNYERPADTYGATRTRLGYLNGFSPSTARDRTVPPSDWSDWLGLSRANAAPLNTEAGHDPDNRHGGPVGAHQTPWGDLSGVGGFDIRPYPPAGDTNTTNTTHAPQLHQNTSLNFYGSGEGHEELGAKVARYQSSINADLLRSLQGASVG